MSDDYESLQLKKEALDYGASKMKLEHLKHSFKELWESVHISECFNSSDVVMCEILEKELNKRGYEVVVVQSVEIHEI